MRPFWYPLSSVFVPDPPSLATPAVLRLMLRAGTSIELLYAGDRMWPTLRHGQIVRVDPLGANEAPAVGSVVLACPSGIPDMLRIESNHGELFRLRGDSDPEAAFDVPRANLLARLRGPARRRTAAARSVVRLLLDLRDAVRGRIDPVDDPARTVLSKYEAQAPFYAANEGNEMSEEVLCWFRERIRVGGNIFVAGCGAGRESFALARNGWKVTGVDFSPTMVEHARRGALRRGLDIGFRLADLRAHEEPAGSFDCVYFTADVYSFIPGPRDRVRLLERMSRWLQPGGVVFLSARRVHRIYEPFILTVQRLSRLAEPGARWGQSHTRWIATDGSLHRSFVQVFTGRALRREAAQAGFVLGLWRGNFGLLTPISHLDVPLEPSRG